MGCHDSKDARPNPKKEVNLLLCFEKKVCTLHIKAVHSDKMETGNVNNDSEEIFILKNIDAIPNETKEELAQRKSESSNAWFIATMVLLGLMLIILIALIVWACVAPSSSCDCVDCVCDTPTGSKGQSCASLLLQRENELAELSKQLQRYLTTIPLFF